MENKNKTPKDEKYGKYLKTADTEKSDIIRLNFKKNPAGNVKYGKGYDAIRRLQKKMNSKGIHVLVGEQLDKWIAENGKKYVI